MKQFLHLSILLAFSLPSSAMDRHTEESPGKGFSFNFRGNFFESLASTLSQASAHPGGLKGFGRAVEQAFKADKLEVDLSKQGVMVNLPPEPAHSVAAAAAATPVVLTATDLKALILKQAVSSGGSLTVKGQAFTLQHPDTLTTIRDDEVPCLLSSQALHFIDEEGPSFLRSIPKDHSAIIACFMQSSDPLYVVLHRPKQDEDKSVESSVATNFTGRTFLLSKVLQEKERSLLFLKAVFEGQPSDNPFSRYLKDIGRSDIQPS